MHGRHSHGKPSAGRIPARTYKLAIPHNGVVPLGGMRYTGNQNRGGFIYHATKGWRRA